MKLVIFGCGKIANRVARSCRLVDEIDLCGFASQSLPKAKTYCELYNVKEYGDYDHFLNSDIDAIYITTYNPSHYELIKAGLEHQKNVICEKPMLFSLEETAELFSLARENRVILMEALKSVFLPVNQKVKELISEGVIGEVREIRSSFMRSGDHPDNHWINDPKTGGAIRDLGSYCVGTMNFIMEKPGRLLEKKSDRTEDKAESTGHLVLDYGGVKGYADVSNSLDGDHALVVKGDRGLIRVDDFWKAADIYYESDGESHGYKAELISDFYYELKHFAGLWEKGLKESDVMSRKATEDILRVTMQENY